MTKTTEALINRLVWSLFITADELRRYSLKDLEARDKGRIKKLPELPEVKLKPAKIKPVRTRTTENC